MSSRESGEKANEAERTPSTLAFEAQHPSQYPRFVLDLTEISQTKSQVFYSSVKSVPCLFQKRTHMIGSAA